MVPVGKIATEDEIKIFKFYPVVSADSKINNPKPTKEEELESAKEKIEELESAVHDDLTLFPINIREFFQSAMAIITPIILLVFSIICKYVFYMLKSLENDIRVNQLPFILPPPKNKQKQQHTGNNPDTQEVDKAVE